MPTYEYRCESCGTLFELRQKFADEPLKVHENGCGGVVHRVLSAPALQFKGSGWYITDYGKNSGKSFADSKSSDSGKSESKTESKPDSKTDSKPASPTTTTTDSNTTKS